MTAPETGARDGRLRGENSRIVPARRRLLDPRLAQVELARLGGVRVVAVGQRAGGGQPTVGGAPVSPRRGV
jgi:hypothetical protein